jgi:hypothetical protein
MTLWTFLTIIITAGIISEVIKARYKYKAKASDQLEPRMQAMSERYDHELEAMKKRIRNLEAIAASDPQDFRSTGFEMEDDLDSANSDELNEKLVNNLARKRTSNR